MVNVLGRYSFGTTHRAFGCVRVHCTETAEQHTKAKLRYGIIVFVTLLGRYNVQRSGLKCQSATIGAISNHLYNALLHVGFQNASRFEASCIDEIGSRIQIVDSHVVIFELWFVAIVQRVINDAKVHNVIRATAKTYGVQGRLIFPCNTMCPGEHNVLTNVRSSTAKFTCSIRSSRSEQYL